MKKIFLSFIVAALVMVMAPVTAFAHGGHGGGHHCGGRGTGSAAPRYELCDVDGCEVYGPHQHDGGWYCNQSGVNWADYAACTVDGCAEPGVHEHDGQWYHCANYPNGGGYSGRGRGCYRR